jgi:hypothetical protein
MSVIVVTQSEQDRRFVEQLLSGEPGAAGAKYVAVGEYSEAVSMARTLLVTRPARVFLILGAETTDAEVVARRASYLEDALSSVAVPERYGFFLAKPDVETGVALEGAKVLQRFREFLGTTVAV